MTDKLREALMRIECIASNGVAVPNREVNADALWKVISEVRGALAATADAPPEVTEEMVEALARHRQNRIATVLKTEKAWEDVWPSVRDDLLHLAREDLNVALAVAQPDTAHEEEGK